MNVPVEAYKGLTIVVVEDHDNLRRSFSVLLGQLGASVVEARNGIEGLKAIKSHRPALVLSEVFMPEADGFEMLRGIRALGNDGHIPVIAMNVIPSKVDSERILAAGFNAFLPIPSTSNCLFWTIGSVLGHSAGHLSNDGSL